MTVTIVDRAAMSVEWGHGPYRVLLATVEIGDHCPKCGGLRGMPYQRNFYEDGVSYSVHCWENPCGHVDMYEDVILDGRLIATEVSR